MTNSESYSDWQKLKGTASKVGVAHFLTMLSLCGMCLLFSNWDYQLMLPSSMLLLLMLHLLPPFVLPTINSHYKALSPLHPQHTEAEAIPTIHSIRPLSHSCRQSSASIVLSLPSPRK